MMNRALPLHWQASHHLFRMSRFDETCTALLDQLRLLKATPAAPISLYDIGVPLVAAGFTEDEIFHALLQLQHDKAIELIEGNRLRVTPGTPGAGAPSL